MRSKRQNVYGNSLLDRMTNGKRDFVENTSIEELAKYVSEPNLKVENFDASVNDYFEPGFIPKVVN